MKKLFISAMAILIAGTTFAADYKQSIGLSLGSLNGISYKYFFTDKLALQNDLVVGVQATAAGESWSYKSNDFSEKDHETLEHTTISTVEFVYNPNALYHITLGSIGLDMVVGGGLSIGIGAPYKSHYHDGDFHDTSWGGGGVYTNPDTENLSLGGKFGINAFTGVEYKMPNAPVTFACDFRPGYGVIFKTRSDSDDGYKVRQTVSYHTFDWRLSVSMRYCF